MKEVAEKYSDYQVRDETLVSITTRSGEKEYETAKKSEELDKMGVEWEHCGLEMTLQQLKVLTGKTVLLRGDIDAYQ